PKLHAFLQFWQRQLDGPLVQVRVAHAQLIRPAELKLVGAELRLH
ncbi:MAG: protein usg, partial [Proteobacteria bacterium]|nr:protein usg [Pseudomonadota bacterium]